MRGESWVEALAPQETASSNARYTQQATPVDKRVRAPHSGLMTRPLQPTKPPSRTAGCLVGTGRAFFWIFFIVAIIGLIFMGGFLGLAYISDQPLHTFSDTLEYIGLTDDDITERLRLPALWETLSTPVYTCGAVAALSLVALFVIRTPKPKHDPSMEGHV